MTYIVNNNGYIIDASNFDELKHLSTSIDSVFETREVAEIRSGIIKTDLANIEPSRLFTSKAFVAEAMKILEDELVKSRKENLSKGGF